MSINLANNSYFVAKRIEQILYNDNIYIVTKEYQFKDYLGVDRIIPRCFIHDGASRPDWLEWFVHKDSLNNAAFLKHDFGYDRQYYSRDYIDRQLLIDLLRNPNNSVEWCYIVYRMLRITGWAAWMNNQKKQEQFGRNYRFFNELDLFNLEKAQIEVKDE